MAVAGIQWRMTGASSPLMDITFPINIANAPHRRGYYFAQQYSFVGVGVPSVGYTGLQPRYDSGPGMTVIRAVFSSFINGTTTKDDDYCSPGADGNPGVSCAVVFDGTYGHTYKLEVRNTPGTTTWNGTAIDADTGRRIHIGSYTLPATAGGIEHAELGFVEDFVTGKACKNLPYFSVVFGVPSTEMGGVVGSLIDASDGGVCAGKDNFETHQLPDGGIEISAGFSEAVRMRLQDEGYFTTGNCM